MNDIFTYDPNAAGTKGMVYIGDKILVYRRDANTTLFPLKLDLPGGGPEGKETPFETLQREVKEEFGLEIEPEHIAYVHSFPNLLNPLQTAYFVVAKLPENMANHIQFGDEGMEYFLMSLEEYLSQIEARPSIHQRVVEYLASIRR